MVRQGDVNAQTASLASRALGVASNFSARPCPREVQGQPWDKLPARSSSEILRSAGNASVEFLLEPTLVVLGDGWVEGMLGRVVYTVVTGVAVVAGGSGGVWSELSCFWWRVGRFQRYFG